MIPRTMAAKKMSHASASSVDAEGIRSSAVSTSESRTNVGRERVEADALGPSQENAGTTTEKPNNRLVEGFIMLIALTILGTRLVGIREARLRQGVFIAVSITYVLVSNGDTQRKEAITRCGWILVVLLGVTAGYLESLSQ